jgi:hypothetical protein
MSRWFLGLLSTLWLTSLSSQGQPFAFRAAVTRVAQDGFYRIALPPTVVGQLNDQLSDVRLYDGTARETPYLLKRESPVQYQTRFQPYEVVSKVITPRVSTVLVLRNAAKSRINNLSLIIQNANVRKSIRLAGSNDARTWYVIQDDYVLEAPYSRAATTEVQLLNFPLSDYEYYQLTINDSLSAPLNILRVGYYDAKAENGKYTEVPGLAFVQRDSSAVRQSYLHVRFPSPVRLDQLSLDVRAPTRYHREVRLCVPEPRQKRRRKRLPTWQILHTWEINSQRDNTVSLPGLRLRDFYLVIDNADNPPLTIGAVRAAQLNTYLIAELKAGQAYVLQGGNPDVGPPTYDLAYFERSIPAQLPVIALGPVVRTAAPAATTPTLLSSRWFLWMALGLVMGVLAFVSYRMLKEVGEK